jgi:hypothetical protein
MIAITVFEDLLVAGGYSDSDAAVWYSADLGDTWIRSDAPALATLGLQRIRDLVSTGSQLLAIGSSGLPDQQDAAVWTSRNGVDWNPVGSSGLEAPGDQEAFAVRAVGEQLIAVGITNELGDIDGAVWVREAGEWARVPAESLATPEHQVMLDIAGGGGELPLVVVGCEDPAYRCDTQLATESDAVVWTSDDAVSWARAPEGGRLAGPGDQVMRAVVTYRGDLVAVGSSGGPLGDVDGGVWTSVDGIVWRADNQSSLNVTALGGAGDQSLRGVAVYRPRGTALVGFGVTQEEAAVDGRMWGAREI